jgi:hypothetical protein
MLDSKFEADAETFQLTNGIPWLYPVVVAFGLPPLTYYKLEQTDENKSFLLVRHDLKLK